MAHRSHRHDLYGKPLPSLAETARLSLEDSAANTAQREHLLQRVRDVLDEHYPYLLRRGVHAEVTMTFRVVHGTIQDDLHVGIGRLYRLKDE